MQLDDAFRLLGNFGRFQTLVYLALCFCYLLSGFILMGMVFIGGIPKSIYCTPPPGFTANETVPGYGGPEVDACHMFEVHDGIVTENKTKCRYGWNYDTSIGETTFVMDFDLVCDDAILVKVAQSVLMTGVMVGSVTSGQISDYFGRKVVLHVSLVAEALCGMAMALVNNYSAFVIFYFFFGFFEQGVLNSAFVIIAEMFAPEIRTYAVSGTSIVWGVSVAIVTPVAYLLPNWRHYQLVISLIHLVGVPLWWIVPESTRWLISRGRIKEAEENLHRIARFNGIEAPEYFLAENVALSEYNIGNVRNKSGNSYFVISQDDLIEKADDNTSEALKRRKRHNFTDVVKSRILLRSFLILAFCWFTDSITYYGLSLNSALLAGNKYFNVFLGCIVELPQGIIMVISLKWIGRRTLLSSTFLFSGICCFIIAFLPDKTEDGTNLAPVIVAISTIGKFWVSYTFSMSYVFSPEIMPTVIRQVTLGGCSFSSRIGGILAPFIIYLGDFNDYIPLIILGAFAIASGLLCLILPETRNQALPETIAEGEEYCREIHICSKCRSAYRNNKQS